MTDLSRHFFLFLALCLLHVNAAQADVLLDKSTDFVYPEALPDTFQARSDAAREKYKDNFWIEQAPSPALISLLVMKDVISEKSAKKSIPSLKDFEILKGDKLTKDERNAIKASLNDWQESAKALRIQMCAAVKDKSYKDQEVVDMWYGSCPECQFANTAYTQISASAGEALGERLSLIEERELSQIEKRPRRTVNPDYLAELSDILRTAADYKCLKAKAEQGSESS